MRALVLAVALLLPAILLPAGGATGPSLKSSLSTADVQEFLDELLAVEQIRSAFAEGDTILVDTEQEKWKGPFAGGAATLEPTTDDAATHIIYTYPLALTGLLNAYDRGNTAKLFVKAHYIALGESNIPNKLAYGAAMRTPAQGLLASHTPAVGDTITYGGCSGALAAGPEGDPLTSAYFRVQLCDPTYLVDERGVVVAKLADELLATANLTVLLEKWGSVVRPIETSGVSAGVNLQAHHACVAQYGFPLPTRDVEDPETLTPEERAHLIAVYNYYKCIRTSLGVDA